MKAGDRVNLSLTATRNHSRVYVKGRFHNEVWTYEFKGPKDEPFKYVGQRRMLFMGRKYLVRATVDNLCDRDGFCVISRPAFRPDTDPRNLFGD